MHIRFLLKCFSLSVAANTALGWFSSNSLYSELKQQRAHSCVLYISMLQKALFNINIINILAVDDSLLLIEPRNSLKSCVFEKVFDLFFFLQRDRGMKQHSIFGFNIGHGHCYLEILSLSMWFFHKYCDNPKENACLKISQEHHKTDCRCSCHTIFLL